MTCVPPVPYRITFLAAALSFFHGVAVEKPYASPTATSTRLKYSPRNPDHGWIAPSSIDRSSSEITSSGSTWKRVPRPSHSSQAPYGELNEKLRGASSSNDRPQCEHARCSEKVRLSGSSAEHSRGRIPTSATPSASFNAVSSESVSRRSIPERRTNRSTTTSIVCCS